MIKPILNLCVASLLMASAASGQGGSGDARAFFNIGAKAYQAGKYADAISAFEEAYKREQRPGLLFSLAQAHRMQFFRDSDPGRLRDAVKYYREYLAREPNGKRAGESTEALEKLVPLLERMSETDTGGVATPTRGTKPRVMVSSPTEGAKIFFDGKAVDGATYIAEVTPGRHKVAIRAEGYEDYNRDVVVDPVGGAPPIDVELVEKPAQLRVVAPEGAEIAVDGRFIGLAPQPPIKLTKGRHFLAVTTNGKRAFTKTLTLTRGQQLQLTADLESTGQRTAAWVTLGAGAGALVGSGVLAALSVGAQSDAQGILDDASDHGNLNASERTAYEDARGRRDDYRLASFIAGGAGLALVGTSIVLFSFDEPRVQVPEFDRSSDTPTKSKPATPSSMEVSLAPAFGPHGSALSLRGRF
ncbi:MAG: PEGA domain-containing protein [Polyangiaceae bacterium]